MLSSVAFPVAVDLDVDTTAAQQLIMQGYLKETNEEEEEGRRGEREGDASSAMVSYHEREALER